MENKITISLSDETLNLIHDIVSYENFKNKLKGKQVTYTDEDIIRSAVLYYLSDIKNFYKRKDVLDQSALNSPKKLKNRFKEIAKKQGLKQLAISELTKIDKSNISFIFNNQNQPSMDYFLRLWVVLDYPGIDEMFYREN